MHSFSRYPSHPSDHALTLIWWAAVVLGLLTARCCGDRFRLLALQAGAADLRFSCACLVTVLPLFLSAFAVFFFHRFGAYLACAVRGVSIGILMGVLTAAGGLWLCVLLLFSALGYSPVLLWYLRRRLDMGTPGAFPDALLCLVLGVALSAVDTWVVAPFLAAALSF